VTSDPVPVVEKVMMSGITGVANFALSQSGTLVYVPGGMSGSLARSVTWVSRQGREEPVKAPPRAYVAPRISPDGTRVAFDIRDQENDIWVWDLKRETLARLTFDPGLDQMPVWTPDSRRIIFSSASGGAQNLYWKSADNTGTIERLTTSPHLQIPFTISPDGTRVLFTEAAPKTDQDIWMLALAGPTTPGGAAPPAGSAAGERQVQPLIQTTFNEINADISPDGRWVAYQSNESGSNQVYVRPFPRVDTGRWQVSTNGGTRPLWARSGRELFYESNSALMVVAAETTGTIFNAGNPTKLFDAAPYYFVNGGRTFDVSADGQQFLMIRPSIGQNPAAQSPSLIVIEHWTEELKARTGTK
jgi:serine/threonine-protein kinase